MATVYLPKRLYVSGMPLLLRGWNGLYVRQTPKEDQEDQVEWHLESHNYYGIPIRHTKIIKMGDRWALVTDDIFSVIVFGPSTETNLTPCGEWNDEIRVTKEETMSTWWRSNSGLIGLGTLASLVTWLLWS